MSHVTWVLLLSCPSNNIFNGSVLRLFFFFSSVIFVSLNLGHFYLFSFSSSPSSSCPTGVRDRVIFYFLVLQITGHLYLSSSSSTCSSCPNGVGDLVDSFFLCVLFPLLLLSFLFFVLQIPGHLYSSSFSTSSSCPNGVKDLVNRAPICYFVFFSVMFLLPRSSNHGSPILVLLLLHLFLLSWCSSRLLLPPLGLACHCSLLHCHQLALFYRLPPSLPCCLHLVGVLLFSLTAPTCPAPPPPNTRLPDYRTHTIIFTGFYHITITKQQE